MAVDETPTFFPSRLSELDENNSVQSARGAAFRPKQLHKPASLGGFLSKDLEADKGPRVVRCDRSTRGSKEQRMERRGRWWCLKARAPGQRSIVERWGRRVGAKRRRRGGGWRRRRRRSKSPPSEEKLDVDDQPRMMGGEQRSSEWSGCERPSLWCSLSLALSRSLAPSPHP